MIDRQREEIDIVSKRYKIKRNTLLIPIQMTDFVPLVTTLFTSCISGKSR